MLAHAPRATIDFETRSAANIRNGAWLYARHPTTRILCLSFKLPGDKHPSLWAPSIEGRPPVRIGRPVADLFAYVKTGGLIEAHNVGFERAIWHHIMVKAAGFDRNGAFGADAPPVHEKQWRCSAAKCSAMALPRDLENAAAVLRTKPKDSEGGKLMKLLTKPRKRLKSDPLDDPGPFYRAYDQAEFDRLFAYCIQDVVAEEDVSRAIPDLSDFEYRVWLADQRANWRGVRIDVELVHAAIELDARVKAKLSDELYEITGIESGTKRADLTRWLMNNHLIELPDTTGATLDWMLEQADAAHYPVEAVRVIRIMRESNRTSIAKFKRILQCMDPDDQRVRELVMYHGAATGRWSGKGIQVQNFPRGTLSDLLTFGQTNPSAEMQKSRKAAKADFEAAVEDVKSLDLEWCELIYTDVLALLSSVARGALIPSPGRKFFTADYSAIEARVALWLAGAVTALGVFLRGEDIYCDMASGIYGRTITKTDKSERAYGKVAVLGLGYGMGFLTFMRQLRTYKIKFTVREVRDVLKDKWDLYMDWIKERLWPTRPPEDATEAAVKKYKTARRQAAMDLRRLREAREVPEDVLHELALCKYTVDAYRNRYKEVKQLWADQEDASVKAVLMNSAKRQLAKDNGEPMPDGPTIRCGKVMWRVEGRFLRCRLPYGRTLYYADPTVVYQPTPWGQSKPQLRFMGVHKKTKKWSRMSTYGGSTVENIDQATARDMMAYAWVLVDEAYETGECPFEPITTIHDELVAEADDGEGDKELFERMLTNLPECYEGCPVAAEGSGPLVRYTK